MISNIGRLDRQYHISGFWFWGTWYDGNPIISVDLGQYCQYCRYWQDWY